MSKQIFEETGTGGPHRGHAAGDTDVQKQASQLASDVKYKVKKGMSGATNMNPAQVAKAYLSQLAKSPAPPAVKALAKKKLIGEDYTSDINNLVKESLSKVFNKVFVDGIEVVEEKENEYIKELQEKTTHAGERLYHIRVTDKKTGNTYTRNATRAKIAELRANPNISSVEMSALDKDTEEEKTKGEKTAKVKAGKGLNPGAGEEHEGKYGTGGKNTVGDLDKDGTKEPDRHEYAGVKDTAIKKAIAKRKGVKEEFLVSEKKTEKQDEPRVEGLKGKKTNKIKIFPEVSEQVEVQKQNSSSSTQNVSDQEKKKQQQIADRLRNQEASILQKKLQTLKSAPKGTDPSIMASYEPDGEQIDEKITAKTDMGAAIKDFYASKSPQLAGRTKEQRRQAAIAAVLTARRGGKKLGEECGCEDEKKTKSSETKEIDPREVPTKMNMVRNKLRAMGLKMSYEPEGEMTEAWYSGRGSYRTTASGRSVRRDEPGEAEQLRQSDAIAKDPKVQAERRAAAKARLSASGKFPIKKKTEG